MFAFFVFAFGVLVQLVETEGTDAVIDLLHEVFKTVQAMNPSKDANVYWQAVNRTILGMEVVFKSFGEPRKLQLLRV